MTTDTAAPVTPTPTPWVDLSLFASPAELLEVRRLTLDVQRHHSEVAGLLKEACALNKRITDRITVGVMGRMKVTPDPDATDPKAELRWATEQAREAEEQASDLLFTLTGVMALFSALQDFATDADPDSTPVSEVTP